jgi:hypothetical protein
MLTMSGQDLRFRIGEQFPADDAVARWLTVLAMASNDFFRMFRWVDCAESAGTRLLAFRIQAAAVFEAATHLSATVRRVPEVKSFYDYLPSEARDVGDRIRGAVDPGSEHYLGDWAEPHRNVIFHYPEMHPEKAQHGKEEIKLALESAANMEGSITADGTFGSVRFDFADEVAVQMVPEATPEDALALERVRDTGVALVTFVQHAANVYLKRLPAGSVRRPADQPEIA